MLYTKEPQKWTTKLLTATQAVDATASLDDAQPKQVALFLRYLGGGGADQMMLNLAEGFVKQGLRVDLVLGKAWGPHLSKIPANVRVVDLDAPKLIPSFFGLVRYLRREQPLALLSTLHYSNELAVLARWFANVPTKVMVREANVFFPRIKKLTRAKKHLLPILMRVLYPRADGVIAVSEGIAEELSQITGLPPERIQVIYNPTITQGLFEKAQENLDHPWFAPGEPPVILGVGKLEAQKDFPTLIRAFAQVRRQKSARLMILGWGPDRPKLEALIKELGLENDVALPDYVSNPYAYMSKAAVFVLSSAWEGLPNVLIEAMALKIPVVATDCKTGPAEILDNGRYGPLVPVGDSDALAAAILKTLSCEPKPIETYWMSQFSLETSTQKYLRALAIHSSQINECS